MALTLLGVLARRGLSPVSSSHHAHGDAGGRPSRTELERVPTDAFGNFVELASLFLFEPIGTYRDKEGPW